MISIENAYYSANTEQIHIVLYNSDLGDGSYDQLLDNIVLSKVINNGTYSFDCQGIYNKSEFDGGSQAHIFIPVADIPDSSNMTFDISGVTTVEVKTTLGDISRTIWDETQFYTYKTAIIESESGRNGAVRAAKKIARFSFYEQMLLNAAKQGFSTDAAIYYAELLRMSSYGIPTVKQEACYI